MLIHVTPVNLLTYIVVKHAFFSEKIMLPLLQPGYNMYMYYNSADTPLYPNINTVYICSKCHLRSCSTH